MSNVPVSYITKYSSNMRMALNQQGSKFDGTTMVETGSGELYQLQNIIGNGTVKKRRTRNQSYVYDDATIDRVWVPAPGQDYDADTVDVLDKVRSGIDLQGAWVMKHAGTIRRAWDGSFLGGFDGTGGFYGNMYTGKTGATITPFASGMTVPVTTGASAATNMNVTKILAARELLAAGFVEDDDQWFLGVTAHEITSLFQQVQVTSADFQQTWKPKFSADGRKLMGLAGFDFVQIELNNPLLPNYLLTKDGSGYQKNPFWTKSGMCRVPWADQELVSNIDPLPTMGHTIQIATRSMVNYSRTDNARCGIILNN